MKVTSWREMFRLERYEKWLVVIGVIAYAPKLLNKFLWDDIFYFVQNTYVQNPSEWGKLFYTSTTEGFGVLTTYYRPLTSLVLGVIGQVFGPEPLGYHLVQIVLHTLAGLLVFRVFREMIKHDWAAFVLAGIFLVHPVQVQAVAYMASIADSLYVVLVLVGVIVFRRITKLESSKLKIFLVWGLLLTGILAKEIAIVTVGLWGLVWVEEVIRNGRWIGLKRLWKESGGKVVALVGGVGITVGYLVFRFSVLDFTRLKIDHFLPDLYYESMVVRLMTFGKSWFEFVRLVLVPYPLHFYYPAKLVTSMWGWPLVFVATWMGIGWLSVRENKKYKTVWIGFGFAWFTTLLLPMAGLVPVNGLVYDNWLYLPMVGFLVGLGRMVQLVAGTGLASWFNRKEVVGVALVLLMGLTWRQLSFWRDGISWYRYNLRFGDDYYLHNNLATELLNIGEFDEARIHAVKAVEVDPENHLAYGALGAIAVEENMVGEAYKNYLKAIELRPGSLTARIQLINFMIRVGDYEGVEEQAEELIINTPENWQAWQLLGLAQYKLGKAEAEESFNKAIEVADNKQEVRKIIDQIKLGK